MAEVAPGVLPRQPAIVAVVGSRDYPDANARVYTRLATLFNDFPDYEWIVVSGGARGVDRAAAVAASRLSKTLIEHIPDWENHGKRAGMIRNQLIVSEVPIGSPHRLIAFWDGQSPGTKGCVRKALIQRRHVEIWDADNNPCGTSAVPTLFEEVR